MKRTRRTFLKLLAAGSAAVATRPAAALAAARAPKRPSPKPAAAAHPAATGARPAAAPAPGLHAEIERQKRDLDKVLKTLRDYPLPPGSDPAFVFAPLRAEKKP